MKACNSCNKIKEDLGFYKNKKTKDGLTGRCKECINKINIDKARRDGVPPKGLVSGVGVMDLKGESKTKAHRQWESMLGRCYNERCLESNPTYKDKRVCDSWLLFSNFKRFHDRFYFDGAHLDKDILVSGNKVYSPETCLFVNYEDNNLLGSRSGDWPQGVYFIKRLNKFIARFKAKGKEAHLGCFDTPEEAHEVATKVKSRHIYEVAIQRSGKLKGALTRISLEVAWSSIPRIRAT